MGTDDNNHNRRRHTGPFSLLLLSGRGRPSTTHLLRLLLLVALVSLLGISTTSIRLSGSAGGSHTQEGQGAEEIDRVQHESLSFLEARGGRLGTTAMKAADLARHSTVVSLQNGQKVPLTRSMHSQATCEDLHRSSGSVMWRLRDQALEGERTRGGIAYVGEKPFQPQWGIQQVYVVHYSPDRARRERMQEQLEKLGFNGGVYVTGMDVNDMTDVQLCALYRPMLERGAGRDPAARHKVPYWVSSTAKHHLALWDQARSGYNTTLVLEDDACVRLPSDESDEVCADSVNLEELRQLLPQKLALLPADFDLLFIGGCRRDLYNDKFKIVKDTLARATASRCVSAMVVSLSGARKLLDALPFAKPMDIHINGVIGNMKKKKKKQMQVYWLVPQLLGQTDQGGSHATKR